MSPLAVLVAGVAGLLIGLSLGLLGGGGSILAVPALLALGQGAGQATTGSLAVVAATSLVGAVAAHRGSRGSSVLVARGLGFGVLAIGGAALGARAAGAVPEDVLLLAFAALLLLVAAMMTGRLLRARRGGGAHHRLEHAAEEPIITFSPTFACACPRALKVLVTATAVGLLTGFLGVGGGFLVVPALVLALGLPMTSAAGTSLVVISVTSLAALVLRLGTTETPDWPLVAVLTALAVAGAVAGTWLARRLDPARLQAGFTVLLLVVAFWTTTRALPALV